MTGQTYYERALKAEARVAELEDELKAWRSYTADAPLALDPDAVFNATETLRPYLARAGRGAPGIARLALVLIAAGGRVCSHNDLLAGLGADHDVGPSLVRVQICYLRGALDKMAPGKFEIRSVIGRGYAMTRDQAERLAIALGVAQP